MKTVTKRHLRSLSVTDSVTQSKLKNAQNLPFSKHFKSFQRRIFSARFPVVGGEKSPTQSNLVQPNPTKSNHPLPTRVSRTSALPGSDLALGNSIAASYPAPMALLRILIDGLQPVAQLAGNWLRASPAIPPRRAMNLFTSSRDIAMPSAHPLLSFLMAGGRQSAHLLLYPHRKSRFYTRNPAKPPTK